MSFKHILGFMFVPRMFIASLLTSMYWGTNGVLITICWIIAVILDVIGIIVKINMQVAAWKIWAENFG